MTTVQQSRPESKHETGHEAFVLEVFSAMTASLVDRATRVFSHTRLSIGVQGVLAVAVGAVIIAWPSASLTAMVFVFAAYMAADGVLSILGSFAERDLATLVHGVVGLVLAAAALAWRDVSATVLVYVIAVWVIVMAMFRVRSAVNSHKTSLLKALLVLLALPSISAGVGALLSPGPGAPSVLIDIAIFQIISGLTIVGVALRAAPRMSSDAQPGHV
jgi:uncharacterized membrane protein HdeD (DUF308 family)